MLYIRYIYFGAPCGGRRDDHTLTTLTVSVDARNLFCIPTRSLLTLGTDYH